MDYLNTHDLTDPTAMAYVAESIDIDNMFDYFILQMYIGNTDPSNIGFYRRHGEGEKWRWIWFGMDWGMFNSNNGGPAYVLNEKGMGTQGINNLPLRKVLENPEMQDKFLQRMGELFQTVFVPENIIPMFEEMVAEIQPEMQLHFERWALEMHPKVDMAVPKNPIGAYDYWLARNARAYNVFNKRPNIFWGMVQEHFNLSNATMLEYFGERPPLPEL